MSKKVVALIVGGSLLIFGLFIGGAGYFTGGMNSVYFTENGVQVVNEREENIMSQDLGSFKNIDLSVLSVRVNLIKSNKNGVEYSLPRSEKVIACEVINDTLTFKTEYKMAFSILSFDIANAYVNIYYTDDTVFDNVYLKSASGSVNVDRLEATGNVSLISISGSVNADNVKAGKFYTESVSGSRKLSSITADEMIVEGMSGSANLTYVDSRVIDIKNVSGGVYGDRITCNEITAKNTSGSIKLEDLTSKNAVIKGGSGSILLRGNIAGKTTVTNISGSIKVYTSLPKSEFGYRISSVSGSTKVNEETFNGSTGEDNGNFIDAKSTSGSVRIYFE